MATATISQKMEGAITRAQAVWLTAVQIAVLALLVLALLWAGAASDYFNESVPLPSLRAGRGLPSPMMYLLLLLAAGHLVIAAVPALRRGPLAGMWGGVTLATACWLAARVTFLVFDKEFGLYEDSKLPIIAVVVTPLAVVLAVWGTIVRARLADAARLGAAALAGGLLLACFGVGIYLLIAFNPTFRELYDIDVNGLNVLLASIALFSTALWLGSAGLRPAGGWLVQPLGMALILGIFFVCWRVL